jgi:hypothetical protein
MWIFSSKTCYVEILTKDIYQQNDNHVDHKAPLLPYTNHSTDVVPSFIYYILFVFYQQRIMPNSIPVLYVSNRMMNLPPYKPKVANKQFS